MIEKGRPWKYRSIASPKAELYWSQLQTPGSLAWHICATVVRESNGRNLGRSSTTRVYRSSICIGQFGCIAGWSIRARFYLANNGCSWNGNWVSVLNMSRFARLHHGLTVVNGIKLSLGRSEMINGFVCFRIRSLQDFRVICSCSLRHHKMYQST